MRLQHQQDRALADFVAELYLEFPLRTRMTGGNLHRRLIGFNRNQALLGFDGVTGFDQQLDHRDVFEIANIGNLDLYFADVRSPLQRHTAEIGQQLGQIDIEPRCQGSIDYPMVGRQ